VIETAATLTDETIDLNDRLLGSFLTRSKNKYARALANKASHQRQSSLLCEGRSCAGRCPRAKPQFVAAIEAVVLWEVSLRV